MFKLFMGAITGFRCSLVALGIMKLLSSVTRHTEIGIRKAAGARDRDILRQFLPGRISRHLSRRQLHRLALACPGLRDYGWNSAVSQAPFLITRRFPGGRLLSRQSRPWSLVSHPDVSARRAARLSPIDDIRHE